MNFHQKSSRVILLITAVCFLLVPLIAYGQAIKTGIAEIISNPDQYDGKWVRVEGKVTALSLKISKRGNAYTVFKLKDLSNNVLGIFSFGMPSIQEGETVRVIGVYHKVRHVPPRYTFYNEIDASHGTIEKAE
jgi:hypothetical protein